MKTKNLRQSRTFSAKPKEVYEALMDSKKHTKFSGAKSKISTKVGGKFSVFAGYIDGENVELVPGKLIVQTWRAQGWPEGHYSTIRYALKGAGGKTKLTFTHNRIPTEAYESIKKGWINHYWGPIEAMLTGQKIVHPEM